MPPGTFVGMSSDDQGGPPRSGLAAAAARQGLVRPLQGRYVAGVSAALGHATRTDPVLWRVILVVLACFGGVGLLVYLLLWLLLPEETDECSPIEALFGQGRSNSSPVATVLLIVVAALVLVLIASRPLQLVLIVALVTLAAALLLRLASPGTPAEPAAPAQPGASAAPPGPAQPGASTAPAGPAEPAAPVATWDPPPPQSGATGAPATGPQGRRAPVVPVTFFAGLIVLGSLCLLDLAGLLSVSSAGYIAAALGVTGAGMLVGARLGGGRPLIAVGLLLTLVLPVAHLADTFEPRHVGTEVTWTPPDTTELDDTYHLSMGTGVLDLRDMELSGREVASTVRVSLGEIRVRVPPDVRVEVDARVNLGTVGLFGTQVSGIHTSREVADPGKPGAGVLRLDVHADIGHVEVTR